MPALRVRTVVVSAVAVMALIQLIPVRRDNPPATGPIAPPAPVAATLRRACYDCHSHETVWPWYSRVAPVSWLVAHDVHEGRRHLDFSDWNAYPIEVKRKKLAGISSLVWEKEMPLWYYLPLHKSARLSEDDMSEIGTWADSSVEGEN